MSVQLISTRRLGGDEILQFQTQRGTEELHLHHPRAAQGVTPFTLSAAGRSQTGALHLSHSGNATAAGLYWRAKGAFRTRLAERGDEVIVTHLPTGLEFTLRRSDVPLLRRALGSKHPSPATEIQGVGGSLTLRGTCLTLERRGLGGVDLQVGPEPLWALAEQLAAYTLDPPAPTGQYRAVNPTELRTLCEKLGLTGVDAARLAQDHPDCGRLLAQRGQTLHASLCLNGADVLITLDEHGTRLRGKAADLHAIRLTLLDYLPAGEALCAQEPARVALGRDGRRA